MKLIESAEKYLTNASYIHFNIQSNNVNENWEQIKYINNILQKCQNINRIEIDLHQMSIDKTIELRFLPNINIDEIIISNGIFEDNQSNMICIVGNVNTLYFYHCKFSFSRLNEFAKYIDDNAEQFKRIEFYNNTITDIDNIKQKLENVCYRRYNGALKIWYYWLEDPFDSILSILQHFSAIKSLNIRLPLSDSLSYSKQSIEYTANYSNLSNIVFDVCMDRLAINWNNINTILRKCPILNSVQIHLKNTNIDEPIDLEFKSNADIIDIKIIKAKFKDNQSNMICIGGDIKQINIRFVKCEYKSARLMEFAKYINENIGKFNKIEFIRDKFVIEDELDANQFDNIVFQRRSSDSFAIIKRTETHTSLDEYKQLQEDIYHNGITCNVCNVQYLEFVSNAQNATITIYAAIVNSMDITNITRCNESLIRSIDHRDRTNCILMFKKAYFVDIFRFNFTIN